MHLGRSTRVRPPLRKGKADLRGYYEKLADENLRDELECLVLALHTDLIGPDDFAPYRYSG